MNGHWYVVASQLRVKIFTQDQDNKKLKLLKSLENPLGRERSRNLHGKKLTVSSLLTHPLLRVHPPEVVA